MATGRVGLRTHTIRVARIQPAPPGLIFHYEVDLDEVKNRNDTITLAKHLYATKGGDPDKNDAWLAEMDKLFEGIESVKLEYKTLQFPGKFKEPLPKESVPDFQLEQEETYSAWYKRMQAKAKTAGRPIAISGYFITRVRAVIVAFSSNAFARGLIEICEAHVAIVGNGQAYDQLIFN